MTFQFRPAVREQTKLLIAISGSSGSGKTYSALRLARGLAGPKGRIAVIDSEAKRALHYADEFDFDHGDLMPPFRPETYLAALREAEAGGYDVIVIDSMSHEYEGEGGILEWADQLKRTMKSPKNWIEPKLAHKRMVQTFLQQRAHLVFCMRADQKMKTTTVNGKMKITPAEALPPQERWKPITEKSFIYEMTVSLLMTADRPGIPIPIKLENQHRGAFPLDQPVGEAAGTMLSLWANGGAAPQPRDVSPAALSYALAEAAAQGGRQAFSKWWRGPGAEHRAAVHPRIDELKAIVEAVEASNAAPDSEDPFAPPPQDEPEPPPPEEPPFEEPPGEPAPTPDLYRMPDKEFDDLKEQARAAARSKQLVEFQRKKSVNTKINTQLDDQQRSKWAALIDELTPKANA